MLKKRGKLDNFDDEEEEEEDLFGDEEDNDELSNDDELSDEEVVARERRGGSRKPTPEPVPIRPPQRQVTQRPTHQVPERTPAATVERFEAFHQPEIIGVRDNETKQVMVLKQKTELVDDLGLAICQAAIMNQADRLDKRL